MSSPIATPYETLHESPINSDAKQMDDIIYNITDDREEEDPVKVGLRFQLDQISSIDTINECYSIIGYLCIDWKATERDILSWKQSFSDYAPEYIPSVKPVNCISISMSPEKWSTNNPIGITSMADGTYYNVLRVQLSCTFREPFELQNFPFDVQNLTFIFEGVQFDFPIKLIPSRIAPDDFFEFESTYSSIHDWSLENVDVINIGSHRMCFRIQISRNALVICVRFAFWILLLGVLAFNCFAINPREVTGRLSYVMYVVLSIVAQQFTIGANLPNVVYFTFIDKYNWYIFITVMMIAFECVFVGYYDIEDHFNVNIDITDQWFVVAILGWFILGHIIFAVNIYLAIRFEKSKLFKTKRALHELMQFGGYWKYKGKYRHKITHRFSSKEYYIN